LPPRSMAMTTTIVPATIPMIVAKSMGPPTPYPTALRRPGQRF
jgi:hypothetical protein